MPLTVLPEALTLDAGHTFLFPNPSLGEMYARKLKAYGLAIEADWVNRNFPLAWAAARDAKNGLVYGTTHAEGLQFWIEVNRQLLAHTTLESAELTAFVTDLYDCYARGDSWRVDPDLDRLLDHCRQLAIPVALISNWDQRLRELLTDLGLVDRFHTLVISAEVGREKPDAEIFAHALHELDRPADTALHVGDSWREDILGAHAAGMKALWLAPPGSSLPSPLPGVARATGLADLADHFAQVLAPVG